ncbi:hypothetical protein HDF16_005443 [Granulicella aggregans]|uniref:Uncharacterized protein n=1 Tax=Granulicella aggregans TaxID=474949 RepID=A0A7W8E6I6_9BACT|nr:hypothetical protein [Granulicella aggregans]MBB5060707.1 hypothetical protein [Granulicella aggregans]
MDTLEDGIAATQKAVEVLQSILIEETLEYFTAPYSQTTTRAGRRMLDIGPLLYSQPRDALQISLWEALGAMYPKMHNDEAYARSLFRDGAWELAMFVTIEMTWTDFDAAVMGKIPERELTSTRPRVVPIH